MQSSLNESLRHSIEIMNKLPQPNYPVNFQPTFPDQAKLLHAVHELTQTTPATNPADVRIFREGLRQNRTLFIFGSCHEQINVGTDIEELAEPAIKGAELLSQSNLANPLIIYRGLGQSTKPRSNEHEKLEDGSLVVSFQGDAVNGRSPTDREPDPSRMVACAIQARSIRETLVSSGLQIPVAHETLLLPYEQSFIKADPETGNRFLLSADLPWIGLRTNKAKGAHVDLLTGIENPVGVKIDSKTTEQDIIDLTEKLNPDRETAKLIFMPRFGLSNIDVLNGIAKAIRQHSPNAQVLYDIHGATSQLKDGTKVRNVEDIKLEMTQMAEILLKNGLKLNGGHFETTHKEYRLECVDNATQTPTHDGDIDPRLNPRQTLEVANHLAELTNET